MTFNIQLHIVLFEVFTDDANTENMPRRLIEKQQQQIVKIHLGRSLANHLMISGMSLLP